MGINSYHSKPILFEKSLKLLATLSQFPNFETILTTNLQTSASKIEQYAVTIRDILSQASPNSAVISVVGEQLEKLTTSVHVSTREIISNTLFQLLTKERLLQGNKTCLSLLNYRVINGFAAV